MKKVVVLVCGLVMSLGTVCRPIETFATQTQSTISGKLIEIKETESSEMIEESFASDGQKEQQIETLPQTGEKTSSKMIVFGVSLIIILIGILIKRRKNNEK